ncbi:MAG TPA: hypothetical protein VFC72_01135 [Corynebacterium sp.]|nr:hypothetical protein [Corynebacterium sp.]
MSNYAPGRPDAAQPEEPLIGFRLPEHERPDHPDLPGPGEEATTQMPRLDNSQHPDSPTTKE